MSNDIFRMCVLDKLVLNFLIDLFTSKTYMLKTKKQIQYSQASQAGQSPITKLMNSHVPAKISTIILECL